MVTCTACLIVKNEAPYLLEWIAYYDQLGFDKIVVYENNSTDNSLEILQHLDKCGIIETRPWKTGATSSPQISAYADALRKISTDWIFFVDCDEFLVLHNTSLKTFLEPFDARPEVSAVAVNWRIFGSSGLKTYEEGLVIERFVMASEPDFPPNRHVKSFVRAKDVGAVVHMHLSDVKGLVVGPDGVPASFTQRGITAAVDISIAQLNHYYTKTPEEYLIKRNRGQAGEGENSVHKYWYNDETFTGHDRNDVEDRSALQYLSNVKSRINQLKNANPIVSFWRRLWKYWTH
jgi:glycosyltransferase involved in cell wall biosynthesis